MLFRIASLAVLLPVLAGNPRGESAKGVAELQGAWRLVGVDSGVGEIDPPEARPILVIKGDHLVYGGETIARIMGDSATKPKLLDLQFDNPQRVFEGVFVVTKDTLKICLNAQSDGVRERPQSFAIEDHPSWRLLTLERAKADDPKAGNGFVGMALGYNDDRTEVRVTRTLEGSPAKKAGVMKDDMLLLVGGLRVTDLKSAVEAVRRTPPRTDLTLRVRRDGKEMNVTVKVGLIPFTLLAGLQ